MAVPLPDQRDVFAARRPAGARGIGNGKHARAERRDQSVRRGRTRRSRPPRGSTAGEPLRARPPADRHPRQRVVGRRAERPDADDERRHALGGGVAVIAPTAASLSARPGIRGARAAVRLAVRHEQDRLAARAPPVAEK